MARMSNDKSANWGSGREKRTKDILEMLIPGILSRLILEGINIRGVKDKEGSHSLQLQLRNLSSTPGG